MTFHLPDLANPETAAKSTETFISKASTDVSGEQGVICLTSYINSQTRVKDSRKQKLLP